MTDEREGLTEETCPTCGSVSIRVSGKHTTQMIGGFLGGLVNASLSSMGSALAHEKKGADVERKRIVEWLRNFVAQHTLADRIEKGEHIPKKVE